MFCSFVVFCFVENNDRRKSFFSFLKSTYQDNITILFLIHRYFVNWQHNHKDKKNGGINLNLVLSYRDKVIR